MTIEADGLDALLHDLELCDAMNFRVLQHPETGHVALLPRTMLDTEKWETDVRTMHQAQAEVAAADPRFTIGENDDPEDGEALARFSIVRV